MKSKSFLFLIKFLNFLFNSVRAKNEFLIEWICFGQLFSRYHLVVSRQVRKREATRRFVETGEWLEQKSSESSGQLFIGRTLKLGFVKVICLVCRKVV